MPKIMDLGNRMGDLLTEIVESAVKYNDWWVKNMVEKTEMSMMPSRTPMFLRGEILEHIRNLIQEDRDAIQEAFDILKEHPTNKDKLSSGDAGYDHRARYAYLVLKDRMMNWKYSG